MNDMTFEQIKQKRKTLDSDIHSLLDEFYRCTGCMVSEIDITIIRDDFFRSGCPNQGIHETSLRTKIIIP